MRNTAKARGKPSSVVYCVLHEGRITLVSSSCLDVSGIAPEAYTGASPTEFVHPDDQPRIAQLLEPGWSGSFSEAIRVRDADGGWSWRMARGVRTIDASGQHSAVVRLKKIDAPTS